MTIEQINAAVVYVGVPAIVVALVYIGAKLHLLDSLEKSTEKIKHNMKVVSDYLTRHHTKFNPAELQAISPLELTPTGTAFLKQIGFENVFKENKTDFFDCIDGEKPKLKYDVETAAIKSIYAMYEKPYMDFLKVFFYANPTRNLENTAPTLGVYIREEYLKAHPEITQ